MPDAGEHRESLEHERARGQGSGAGSTAAPGDLYEQRVDKLPGVVYIGSRSMYPRVGAGRHIRSGFGSVPVVDFYPVEQGPWERDRVVTERELLFAWFLWGITCLRVGVLLTGP
jgi:hypothetical protein